MTQKNTDATARWKLIDVLYKPVFISTNTGMIAAMERFQAFKSLQVLVGKCCRQIIHTNNFKLYCRNLKILLAWDQLIIFWLVLFKQMLFVN